MVCETHFITFQSGDIFNIHDLRHLFKVRRRLQAECSISYDALVIDSEFIGDDFEMHRTS